MKHDDGKPRLSVFAIEMEKEWERESERERGRERERAREREGVKRERRRLC